MRIFLIEFWFSRRARLAHVSGTACGARSNTRRGPVCRRSDYRGLRARAARCLPLLRCRVALSPLYAAASCANGALR